MGKLENSERIGAGKKQSIDPREGAVETRTFPVSDVKPATKPLPEIPYHQAVADFLGGPVESSSRYHGRLVANLRSHPLIGTLHAAFATHRPVCLSPDIIWLTLAQGLANHINANAEPLRNKFVRHEGKLKITVRRDDFVKGAPENPWPEVFEEFSVKIAQHIGDAYSLIVADFSTTGPVERAASEVVLLDAMQAFFSYEMHTLCGIPNVTLEGTAEDWQAIADRVAEFSRFELDWWVKPLAPILREFAKAASGKPDRTFWNSIYKWNGPRGSGSPYVSGWIVNLFPYLVNPESRYTRELANKSSGQALIRNRWVADARTGLGPGREDFPCLPSRAPFVWKYLDRDYEMDFIGGLMGIRQDPDTLCLRPEIGWVVREEGTPTFSTRGRHLGFDSDVL